MKKYLVNAAAIAVVIGGLVLFNSFEPERRSQERFEQAAKDARVLEAETPKAPGILSRVSSMIESMNPGEAEKSGEDGAAFQEEYAKGEGVTKLASGVQYKVLFPGNGSIPALEDTVSVHYTGKLVNGKVFDSSVRSGAPLQFRLTSVIKGWTEALQLMPEGSTWEVVIPSELAYGEKGRTMSGIPGNATLIFEIELIEVMKSKTR